VLTFLFLLSPLLLSFLLRGHFLFQIVNADVGRSVPLCREAAQRAAAPLRGA
jgi:hypothetical protein